MNTEIILLIQLVSTSFMCGVIWVVQLLVYPNFLHIPADNFKSFHARHSSQITWIVFPGMLAELFCAVILLYFNQEIFFVLNFLTVLLVWFQTAFISVPLHNALSKNFDEVSANKLIRFNWIRSFVWSFRVILLINYIYL